MKTNDRMKIVHVIPGSGGSFYCGNCLRDSKLFEAIRKKGHDVIILPMYLPLFAHDNNNKDVPVFFGAISIYIKQNYPLFRKMPQWLEKLLNSKPMLKLAAGMANSTRAKGLEDMTVSMLMGEEGQQKKELETMIKWLEDHYKPDLIHISNALLLGLAPMMKKRLNVPIVCSLQDEDVWVDVMSEPFREKVWELMKQKTEHVDKFISVSNYFTDLMKKKMQIDRDKIQTLYLGVNPADYKYINSIQKPRNIGFISRLSEENGLDILIDAFILLKNHPHHKDTKLLLTGGHTADDKKFLKTQKLKITLAGLKEQVEFLPEFDDSKRADFFNQTAVLSVPVRKGEAFGIYLAEAMASGIAIVQPKLGAFPEVVEISKGGITYENNDPQSLANAWLEIFNDEGKLKKFSENAVKSVETEFNINNLAGKMIDIYNNTIQKLQNQ